MKLDENSFNIMEAMTMSLKGDNFIKMHYRVMSFGQNVALVMVKLDENSLPFVKVVAEIC